MPYDPERDAFVDGEGNLERGPAGEFVPDVILPDDYDWEDVDTPAPTVVDANLDLINRMLGAMDKLTRQVAEYARLEEQDKARAAERREKAIGPALRRIDFIRGQVLDFAVAAWRREKRGRFALPNGTIKSTKVMDVLTVDADRASGWLLDQAYAPNEIPVWYKPEVDKRSTRKLLDRLETEGVVKRIVKVVQYGGFGGTEILNEDAIVLGPDDTWTVPFAPGESGHWMVVEDGSLVEGIQWSPNGDDGVGRNFSVDL